MKTPEKVLYSFDTYLVDVAEKCLWRDDKLISLTPKAFHLLIVLIEHKGRALEKEVLLKEVWQDTFVEEATLSQNIFTLRKALGKTSDGKQFIETVPRHGYRFVGEVKESFRSVEEAEVVVTRSTRTHITAESEKLSDEEISQSNSESETLPRKIYSARTLMFRLRRNWLLSAILAIIAAAAAYFGILSALKPAPLSSSLFKEFEVSAVTSNGNINLVTISPDGKYLAIVEQQGENQSLLLRQINSSAAIEIVSPGKQQFVGVTFSPDDQQIYYVTYDLEKGPQPDTIGILYKISILGGPSQKVAADVDSPAAISPDGKQIAFIRHDPKAKQSMLIVAALDNKEEKKLTVRELRKQFSGSGVAWSPDGKMIAATALVSGHGLVSQMEAIVVNAATGEQKSLTLEKYERIGTPNWLADGSGLVFTTFNGRSGDQTSEIYEISYPEEISRKITRGINGFYSISLTADSKVMVAVKSDQVSSFWVSSTPADPRQATNITRTLSEPNTARPGINWTPDGKVVYSSTLKGNQDIWIMDADGSHKKELTNDDKTDCMPVVSPDGQSIYFISDRTGKPNIWRMKIDGSEQTQLTAGEGQEGIFSPGISPDGKTIFYSALDKLSRKPFLYKISVNGGESVQVSSISTVMPQISPDGKWIACYSPKNETDEIVFPDLRITVLSAETGQIAKQFGAINQDTLSVISWTDNQTLSYTTRELSGGSHLWQQSLDKSQPKVILDLPDERIFRFVWSNNGQNLIYEKGLSINSIILIKSI